MIRKLLLVSAFLLCASIQNVFSQVDTSKSKGGEKDLLDMDLEALLNMDVSTVSKKSESQSKAAAIIEVITEDQIQSYGVDNLYELLSFVAGVEVMETYYGYTAIQFRGILQSHYNNKSNLLLNGQPLYDQIVSCYYLEQIPVSAISRIEIVRGPSAVIYGTNAYAGVINIITKQPTEELFGKAIIKGGSFETKNIKVATGKKIDDLSLFFAAEYNDSKGYEKIVAWDEDDIKPDTVPFGHSGGSRKLGYYSDDPDAYENDFFNIFSQVKYKNFELNTNYFNNQKDKFGIIPTLVSTGERNLDGFSSNFRYNHSIKENEMSVSVITWFDGIRKIERVNKYSPVLRAPGLSETQEYSGSKFGGQHEFYLNKEKLSLIAGFGGEQSNSEPYLFYYTDSLFFKASDKAANAINVSKTTRDYWVFAQGNYDFNDKLRVMLGSRFNNNQQAGSIIVPNAGIVITPMNNLSFKLLYGMGYRNPSFFEKYVRTVNTLAGDENLKTEVNQNFEIGTDITFSKYNIRLNGFYMITDNEITRKPLDSVWLAKLNSEPGFGSGRMRWTKGAVYVNSDGNTYQGVELSFMGYPTDFLYFRGNVTYKQAEKKDKSKITEFAPITANLLVSLKLLKRISIIPNVQYIGERKVQYAPLYPWQKWTRGDYTIKSYSLVNLKLAVEITKNLELAFIGKNLLNEDYYYPEYIRRAIPYIPGGPNRAFYGEMTFKF